MTGAGVIGGSWIAEITVTSGARATLSGLLASCLGVLGLAVRLLAGLGHLHSGIGRHQAALVRQGHELKAHIDRAHRAVRTAAMDAGIEPALAALLHYLFIDLQDFRLLAVELWHQAVGVTEVRGTDVDACDALHV